MALKLQLCIKIKFFKKTKKVVYISANCTYNVNIKKVKEKLKSWYYTTNAWAKASEIAKKFKLFCGQKVKIARTKAACSLSLVIQRSEAT